MLEQSWAGVFRAYLLSMLEVEKLSSVFSPEKGRPTKDLYAALSALILQQLHDLTDAKVGRAHGLQPGLALCTGYPK